MKTLKKFRRPTMVADDIFCKFSPSNNLSHATALLCKAKDPQTKMKINSDFKKYRNLIKTLTRRSKRAYYFKYFNDNKTNLRKTWDGIKGIINFKGQSSQTPNCLKKGKSYLTDKIEISNEFNEFFTNIGKNLESKLIKTDCTFDSFLTYPNIENIYMEPATEDEVKKIIQEMDPNKSNGPYSFPTKLLKLIANIISKPISEVINISMTTGTFPDILKTTEVIPIFNKRDRHSCNDYRPISLLSNINKIFEKIIHQRTYKFLDDCKVFFAHQFGFRHKHSTDQALFKITELIRKAIDNKKIACGVFIDLQKAFDTVNHKILLEKLKHYGIRGNAYRLFESYLSKRYQYVSINGNLSEKLLITHGVPQGSVLGPLLFIILLMI